MSAPPFMPLYVADYLADTTHLTCTEHGAYILLLMAMWRAGGSLPDDPSKLARFARCTTGQWARMSPTILEFFEQEDGRIVHLRLAREMTKHSVAVERQRQLSSNGGKAKALKTLEPALPCGTFSECQPEPEPEKNGGGVRASEIETTDDWPDGKAQDHARLIVSEVASPRLDPMKSPGLVTTAGRLAAWKRDGASWEHDVIPVVASVCAKQRGPVSTWKFFDQAIARSMADNRAALEVPISHRATGPPNSLTDRIAAEHAESRRMAFEMLERENGESLGNC